LFDRASVRHTQFIGEAVGKVAQRDFRSEFRGKSRQAVCALPRALAATDAGHNGIEGESVAIVNLLCSLYVLISSRHPMKVATETYMLATTGLRPL
jgi:hypothetical protein